MALVVGSGTSLGGLAGGAATARLLVVISGNSAGLQSALAASTSSLGAFNKNANTLGNAMTRTVTLPLLAVGGASIKLASDFQQSMARVQGLTPILDQTGMSIDNMSNIILEMAKTVPTAPTELANSLYFAGSAGLSASEALQVVNLSAKGAAIGMGNAADISKVLIFALNAYRGTGLDAAEAMDTLTVAIREGTAEPDELAVSLGRLIPVAKAAGVGFAEVVGSVAALTNIGFPTRVATVALRALFAQLLAPTQQAIDNLDQLGISTTELRAAIEAGPLVAFDLLLKSTKGNFDALRNIIPQIRGFSAFLGLTGDQAERVNRIFQATQNATGALDKAFGVMSKTTGFQFALALNDLRIAGIQLGTQLFPVFRGIAAAAGGLGEVFQNMPEWGQKAAAAFIVLGAAAGPLIKVWALLNAEGAGFLATGKSMTAGILVMAVAAGFAISSLSNLASGSSNLITVLTAAGATFITARIGLQLLYNAVNAGALGVNAFSTSLVGLLSRATLVAAILTAAAVAISFIAGESNKATQEAASFGAALSGLGTDATLSAASIRKVSEEFPELETAFLNVAKSAGALGLPISEGVEKTRSAITRSVADMVSQLDVGGTALEATVSKLIQAGGSTKDLANIIAQGGENIDEFVTRLSGTSGVGVADVQGIENLDQLIQLSRSLALAQEDLEALTLGRLALHAAEEGKIESLAEKYGVSTDFAKEKLQEFGATATGLGDDGEDMWAQQAGLIDKTTGAIVGAREEMEAMNAEITASRQEALRGDILGGLFDPETIGKVEGSLDNLLGTAKKNADAMIDMAGNISTLLARGLDPTVLQFLADQGPGMVARFVDASSSELGRLEVAYSTTLGAIDAAVLNEGRHQEGKAGDMIAGFAEAILSNKALPVNAAQNIVRSVGTAFASGRIDQAGVEMITRVAGAIRATSGITKQAAGAVVQGITSALISGQFKNAGAQEMVQLAQGIASSAGVPRSKAASVAMAVAAALAGISATAFAAGVRAMDQLAAGIHAAGSRAELAAKEAAWAVQNALDRGSLGSPKYASFYLGERIMADLAEGMSKAPTLHLPKLGLGRTALSSSMGQGGQGGSGADRGMAQIQLVTDGVTLSRVVTRNERKQRLLLTGRRAKRSKNG